MGGVELFFFFFFKLSTGIDAMAYDEGVEHSLYAQTSLRTVPNPLPQSGLLILLTALTKTCRYAHRNPGVPPLAVVTCLPVSHHLATQYVQYILYNLWVTLKSVAGHPADSE